MTSLAQSVAKAIGNDSGYDGVTGLKYADVVGTGVNVFVGFLPPSPNRVVAVLPSGGLEADSKLPYDSPTIQIIVRGDASPAWALDTWQAVYSYMQGLGSVELPDGIWLVSAIAIQSGPIHIGKDDNGRYQYGMNFYCEHKNPTERRPE